jgi:Winged helix-turn helix
MVRVRPLTEQERGELKRGARREVGRVSERMHAVLLSARGYDVGQIASILEYDEATVRRWIERSRPRGWKDFKTSLDPGGRVAPTRPPRTP